MKAAVMLAALFLAGCSSFQSLEELEAEAIRTGDWSQVEERERILAKRQAREGISCPAGFVSVCLKYPGDPLCKCVHEDEMPDKVSRMR